METYTKDLIHYKNKIWNVKAESNTSAISILVIFPFPFFFLEGKGEGVVQL